MSTPSPVAAALAAALQQSIPPDAVLHDGRLWQPYHHPLAEGYVPVPNPPRLAEGATPTMHYRGPRIPLELWRQAMAFMAWTLADYNGESCVRGFLNLRTHEWAFAPYPQLRRSGMQVTELKHHPGRQAINDRYRSEDGWEVFFSVHHHCKSSAFQSGADAADEAAQDGLHFTVGRLDQSVWDIDARMLIHGQKYNISKQDIGRYFTSPTLPSGVVLPAALVELWMQPAFYLLSTPSADETFPEEWKDALIDDVASSSDRLQLVGFGTGDAEERQGMEELRAEEIALAVHLQMEGLGYDDDQIDQELTEAAMGYGGEVARRLVFLELGYDERMGEWQDAYTAMLKDAKYIDVDAK